MTQKRTTIDLGGVVALELVDFGRSRHGKPVARLAAKRNGYCSGGGKRKTKDRFSVFTGTR